MVQLGGSKWRGARLQRQEGRHLAHEAAQSRVRWKDIATHGARRLHHVQGKVGLGHYGLRLRYVELGDGVQRLIHVSVMSWTQHVCAPSKILHRRSGVQAVVLKVEEVAGRNILSDMEAARS